MDDLTKLSTDALEGTTLAAKAAYDEAHQAETDARAVANAARREVSRLSRIRCEKGRLWDKGRNEQTRRENILNNVGL